jgi:hypothetical protein
MTMNQPAVVSATIDGQTRAIAWKLPTELTWTKADGSEGYYRLPPSISEMLMTRLSEFKASHATWAMRLAMVLMTTHGGDLRPFCIDRRGIAGVDHEDGSPRRLGALLKALNLTEWQVRIGRYLLRAVGFVEQDHEQRRDQHENPKANWRRSPSGMRRAATVFRFGADYLKALHAAVRRSRFIRLGPLPRLLPYTLPKLKLRGQDLEVPPSTGGGFHMGAKPKNPPQKPVERRWRAEGNDVAEGAVRAASGRLEAPQRPSGPSDRLTPMIAVAEEPDRAGLDAALARLAVGLRIKP